MSPTAKNVVWLLGAMLAARSHAQPTETVWSDTDKDARLVNTVSGSPPIAFSGPLPDLECVSVGGWNPIAPVTNPYDGDSIRGPAHMFRVVLVFTGLVCPPGRVTGGFNPQQFGSRPIYGYVDFDVDNDIDTGGEQRSAAGGRLLAVAPRFGVRLPGALAQRTAVAASSLDNDWQTAPQFERSGIDFSLVFCGCSTVSIISQNGNNDSIFDPGETWVVRGRFFQRSGGYTPSCNTLGGSVPGAYDPQTNLQWKHNATTNRTTITLVFPLTQQGAASLAGAPVQPIDNSIDTGGNHSSLQEALSGMIASAAAPGLSGLERELIYRWQGRSPTAYLDPVLWRTTAMFGVAYATSQSSRFAWTDIGFNLIEGDVNGDGFVTRADRTDIVARIRALDGTILDADSTVNNAVSITNFGTNFDLYDVTGNGIIDAGDAAFVVGPCPADWNRDHSLTPPDIFSYLNSYFAGDGDIDDDFATTPSDIFLFLNDYFAGCETDDRGGLQPRPLRSPKR